MSGIYATPVTYGSGHNHTITYPAQGYNLNGQPFYFQEYPTKENTMSTIDKIAAERKEAKERLRLEAAFEAWEEVGVDEWPVGTLAHFLWKQPNTTTYLHDAVLLGREGGWHMTGTARLFTADTLIAWFVEHDITPDEVVLTVNDA